MAKEKDIKKEELPDSVYNRLSQIDVNEKTEQKNGLTYLSWAWAFAEIFKRFPDASYEVKDHVNTYVVHAENTPLAYQVVEPFLFNYHLGYLVTTSVTIEGVTKTMQLPVMDGANKAQKHENYTYKGWEYVSVPGQQKKQRKQVDKLAEAATMFDINTTIMRCLVKNFAMHGLGAYIYAGEDLPEDISALIKKELEEVGQKPAEEVKEAPKTAAKTTTKKTTAKTEAKVEAKPSTEMPDDSAHLPAQPLAESDVENKKNFTAIKTAELKEAKTHDEVFEVLKALDPVKVLAIGTMEFNWKFKNLDEVVEAMSKGELKAVKERLISLVDKYIP